jgi:hypothetical protein
MRALAAGLPWYIGRSQSFCFLHRYRSGELLGSLGDMRITVAPDKVSAEWVRSYVRRFTPAHVLVSRMRSDRHWFAA